MKKWCFTVFAIIAIDQLNAVVKTLDSVKGAGIHAAMANNLA